MQIGLDFGTTNSGAAAFDGQRVRVLPLDPDSHDSTVIRSTLYVTRDHQVSVGQEAINDTTAKTSGGPSRWCASAFGEIEITVADYGADVGRLSIAADGQR